MIPSAISMAGSRRGRPDPRHRISVKSLLLLLLFGHAGFRDRDPEGLEFLLGVRVPFGCGLQIHLPGTFGIFLLHDGGVSVQCFGVLGIGGQPQECHASLGVIFLVEVDLRQMVYRTRTVRFPEPSLGLIQIPLRSLAVQIELAQIRHPPGTSALCRSQIPSEGLVAVLRDSVPEVIHDPDVTHGAGVSRLGGFRVPSGTFLLVPLHIDPYGIAVTKIPHSGTVSEGRGLTE